MDVFNFIFKTLLGGFVILGIGGLLGFGLSTKSRNAESFFESWNDKAYQEAIDGK